MLAVIEVIFGVLFILFLPGFVWSFLVFRMREVDLLERVAISIGLSIATVTLVVFWLNWLFGPQSRWWSSGSTGFSACR